LTQTQIEDTSHFETAFHLVNQPNMSRLFCVSVKDWHKLYVLGKFS